jgi:hypothetical protein
MDKSYLLFLIVGIGFFYLVTSGVEEIESHEVRHYSTSNSESQRYAQFNKEDSIGDAILDVSNEDVATQLNAWHYSEIKNDFIEMFPDFIRLKSFVKDKIRGDVLVDKLTSKINNLEDKYFSGLISAEEAKKDLGILK